MGRTAGKGRRPGIFAGCLLWLLALSVVGCPSREEQIAEARKAVPEALGRGDRDGAREIVAGLDVTPPDDPDLLVELVEVLAYAGETPRALRLLEAGVEKFPGRMDIRVQLASVALTLSNPALARSVAMGVPEDAPEQAEALVLLAQAELALGNLELALTLLEQAETRYPDKPETRLVRIATLSSEHRSDEVEQAVQDAIAAVEGNPEQLQLARRFRRMQVQIQLQKKEFDPALATLRQMLETDPADVAAWQLLVQALAAYDRAAEAVELLEANLAGEAPLAELYALLGPLYARAGDEEKAVQALRSYAANSKSSFAVQPLVQYLNVQGDAAGVDAAIREAIERFPDQPHLYVMHVETLLEMGDRPAAERVTKLHRDLANALAANDEYLRARLELDAGDASTAAERLRKLAPKLDVASTHYWLARALAQLGDSEGARRRFDMARQRDPAWSPPLFALVGLAQARGDWRQVVGFAQGLVALLPQNPEGWLMISGGLIELELGEDALKATETAKKAFPDEPMFRVYHAHALRLQGRHDDALEELAATQQEFADEPAVIAEFAIVLGIVGQVREGIDLLERGLSQHPDEARLHAARAALLYQVGDALGGDRASDRALELQPDELQPLITRCTFRAANRLDAGAIDDCKRYESKRPADPRGPFLLGVAYTGAGNFPAAVAAYRRAVKLDPQDYRPLNNLAWLLGEQGELDAALEAGQEAYRLAPEDPYVADTLADLYLRKGLANRAVALLELAHAKVPEMPEASLHLAQAYLRTSQPDQARRLLEALDASLPSNHSLRPVLKAELDGLP